MHLDQGIALEHLQHERVGQPGQRDRDVSADSGQPEQRGNGPQRPAQPGRPARQPDGRGRDRAGRATMSVGRGASRCRSSGAGIQTRPGDHSVYYTRRDGRRQIRPHRQFKHKCPFYWSADMPSREGGRNAWLTVPPGADQAIYHHLADVQSRRGRPSTAPVPPLTSGYYKSGITAGARAPQREPGRAARTPVLTNRGELAASRVPRV